MINFDNKLKVFVGLEAIDFRCGINKLATIAQALFEKNPRSRILFIFRNKRKTDIKLLLYHRNGFFLGHKRLSRGKLSWWPRTTDECMSLDAEKVEKLLCGMDPRGGFQPEWQELSDHGEQGRAHIDHEWSGHDRSEGALREEAAFGC